MTNQKQVEELKDQYEYYSHVVAPCDNDARPPFEPHDHQREAWAAFQKKKAPMRGILVLPTGAGKTFTAVHWLATRVLSDPDPRPVLWIAHRAELLQQAATKLYEYRGLCRRSEPLEIRCISGLHGKPISTLLAPADATFVTIQSLSRRPDLVSDYFKRNPDCFIVIDEAHHAAAKSYRDVVKKAKTRKRIEILGLTATPTRTIKEEMTYLKQVFPDEILFQAEPSKLMEQGILSIPYCTTVKTNQNFDRTFTPKELKHLRQFGDLPPSVLAKIGHSTSRNKLIVQHYLDNRDAYGKTLVFATDIIHCYSLAESFRNRGVEADYVASKRDDHQRNEDVLGSYKRGELEVLVSVEMLTEGVDVPKTHAVLLARPTGSEILMRQMVGRALRGPRAGGSKEARIVSFADHWERFPDWLDPIAFIPGGLPTAEPPRKPPQGFPVHIPWELISAISELAPEIEPSAVFGATPVGWYRLVAGEPEIGLTTAILVYEHQRQAFEQFIRFTAEGYYTTKGKGGPRERYFSDIPDPIPSNELLQRLARYIEDFGIPRFVTFEEKSVFDPYEVAAKLLSAPVPKIRQEAIQIFESSLAPHFYGTQIRYVDAVFDALREIVAHSKPPVDNIRHVSGVKGRVRPPYRKAWPLERILEDVRSEMDLQREPVPAIRWSKRPLKSIWGLYRPSQNTIVINSYLKTDGISKRTIEFLVYHELLHHEMGIEAGHNRYFRERERLFPGHAEAEMELDTFFEKYLPPRKSDY